MEIIAIAAQHWLMKRKPYKKKDLRRHPGHYIREHREDKGLTQEQIASRVELSVPQVSKIENGEQGYRQATLENFAQAMGCEPADLLRPPNPPVNELAAYVMKLDEAARARALIILRAALG